MPNTWYNIFEERSAIPMAETGANREYRDRLFKFIFGNLQNKEWTLSLYNAINGSHYIDVRSG